MESWEERQLELSMLDTANRNSYAVLTGSIDMESLKDDEFMLVHNPFEPETEDLTGIMEYFIQTEEYEKCAVIRDLIDFQGSTILIIFIL